MSAARSAIAANAPFRRPTVGDRVGPNATQDRTPRLQRSPTRRVGSGRACKGSSVVSGSRLATQSKAGASSRKPNAVGLCRCALLVAPRPRAAPGPARGVTSVSGLPVGPTARPARPQSMVRARARSAQLSEDGSQIQKPVRLRRSTRQKSAKRWANRGLRQGENDALPPARKSVQEPHVVTQSRDRTATHGTGAVR